MEIISLNRNHPGDDYVQVSFALKFTNTRDIWLFNCNEASQQSVVMQNIKLSQLSKIIITNLHMDNISGLLGLLSSLSLSNRVQALHIYAPLSLVQYIKLGKKYAQTNFRYGLYIHILHTSLVITNAMYNLYVFASTFHFKAILICKEKYGKFNLVKAQNFKLMSGPIYGKLKYGNNFLLPDGFILHGYSFSAKNHAGNKVVCFVNKYHTRYAIEITNQSQLIHYCL